MRLTISVSAITVAAVLAVALYATAQGGGGQIIDSFDDNSIHESWDVAFEGSGVTVVETNERLEFSVAPGSMGTDSVAFSATVTQQCMLAGDFDVQAPYELLAWPDESGVGLALRVGPGTIARQDSAVADGYISGIGFSIVVHDSSSLSGVLGIRRTGSSMQTFYVENNTLTQMDDQPVTTEDLPLSLFTLGSDVEFAGEQVDTAFERVTLFGGDLVCPDGVVPPGFATPTPTPAPTATPEPLVMFVWGDDDCDEDVDAVDGLKNLQFVAGLPFGQSDPCFAIGALVGIVPVSTEGLLWGDVDCDRDVDAVDALGILRHVAGLAKVASSVGCPAIATLVGVEEP